MSQGMMNLLRPCMGELELREVRLTDPTDRLGRTTIDQHDVGMLQAEIDELRSEMLDLEDRLDGLRIALVTASRLGSEPSPARRSG
jgi:hypothetical protein